MIVNFERSVLQCIDACSLKSLQPYTHVYTTATDARLYDWMMDLLHDDPCARPITLAAFESTLDPYEKDFSGQDSCCRIMDKRSGEMHLSGSGEGHKVVAWLIN